MVGNPFDAQSGWDVARRSHSDVRWDVSRIVSWLSVGALIENDEQMEWLRASGVTHVVSAAWNLDDAALCKALGLEFYHVRWRDDGAFKPTEDFLDLLAWVEAEDQDFAAQGRRAHFYVHCVAGAYRSPLLAAFLLATHGEMDPEDAYDLLCQRRGCVSCFAEPQYHQACLAAVAAARSRQEDES